MSFATFGFAYVARPVGAFILGHFGDRLGRRRVLMFTLVLMGASTFLIGCLPSFATIGWAAPALLVLCRLLQGFSAAGEQAGASSLTLEHAPDNRRSFFTSWTLTGTQGGLILASLVMIPFVSMPDDVKYTWAWRVPFWLSAIVVLVAYFIRRRLHETPAFDDAKATGTIARMPLVPLLRNHWKDVIRVVLCAFIAAVSTVFGNLAIAYGKKVGLEENVTLWLVVVANVFALGTQPLFGMLADRIGRKPVFIYGALSSAALMPFYMLSMSGDNELLIFALGGRHVRVRLRRRQRRLAVVLRRDVQHAGAVLRCGDRHPAGLPDGRLRADDRHRARRCARGRLGRHQRVHGRHLRDRRGSRRHRPRDEGRPDGTVGRQDFAVTEGADQPLTAIAKDRSPTWVAAGTCTDAVGHLTRIGCCPVRAVLIVNPNATSTTPAGRDLLAHALESRVKLTVAHTDHRGHAIEIARDAAREGVDVLIVHGGDGTVNEVVNGILGEVGVGGPAPAVGVVPGGSANVFARALGISPDPIEATNQLVDLLSDFRRRKSWRRIGLMDCGERWAVFTAGMGVDGEVVAAVEAQRDKGRKVTAWRYIRVAIRANLAAARKEPSLTLHLPDRDPVTGVHFAFVSNSSPWTYANTRPVWTNPTTTFETGSWGFRHDQHERVGESAAGPPDARAAAPA